MATTNSLKGILYAITTADVGATLYALDKSYLAFGVGVFFAMVLVFLIAVMDVPLKDLPKQLDGIKQGLDELSNMKAVMSQLSSVLPQIISGLVNFLTMLESNPEALKNMQVAMKTFSEIPPEKLQEALKSLTSNREQIETLVKNIFKLQ